VIKWYFGSYRGRHGIYECCYGWLVVGYSGWCSNGDTLSHTFWGFVWRGRYTLGIGRVEGDDS